MPSEAERIFSEAKYTISDERLSLHIDTIEALECLKSWFVAGIFTQKDLARTTFGVVSPLPRYFLLAFLYIFLLYIFSLIGCSAAAQNFCFCHQNISRLIRTVKLTVQFDNFDNIWLSPRTELIVNSSVGLPVKLN